MKKKKEKEKKEKKKRGLDDNIRCLPLNCIQLNVIARYDRIVLDRSHHLKWIPGDPTCRTLVHGPAKVLHVKGG